MNNLLITTTGEYNHVDAWCGGEYDMNIIDYNDTPTFKYEGIYKMLHECSLLDYDYYWMPDEDVFLEFKEITKMFNMAHENNLSLCQPSIMKGGGSYPSWKKFIHNPNLIIENTNFVEVMCPLFSNEALHICMETFTKSKSGWGLDIVWSKMMKDNNLNMGILHPILARHTRPIKGGGLYDKLNENGISPYKEKIE